MTTGRTGLMRRAIALAGATAAWVLLIQVASMAMAPPVIVELSPVDVSRGADSTTTKEPLEFALAPSSPALTMLPAGAFPSVNAGSTTTTAPSVVVPTTATTATTAANTKTTAAVATTSAAAPAPVTTTTAKPVVTTTTTTTTVALATTTTNVAPTTTTTLAAATASFSAAAESEFISKINGLRSSLGVAGLSANAELNNYARWWATQMADSGNFSHSDFPSLLDPWWIVGENVGYGPTVGSIFDKLVASTLHYSNMVDARYSSVGVGTYVDATGRMWTTHLFGG
jgi:uncharacterized protein YkwD